MCILLHDNPIQYKNIKFQVWDLGGQSSIRYVERNLRQQIPDWQPKAVLAMLLPKHVRHHLCH